MMIKFVWPVYLASTMIYIMPSGLPQPSALFLGAMIVLIMLAPLVVVGNTLQGVVVSLLGFVAWCTLISIGHFAWTGEFVYLKAPLYYGYNALTFMVVIQLICRDPSGFARLTCNGLGAMVLAQVVLIIILPNRIDDELQREIGTFNAPNQLAYWAILCISTYMLLPGRRLLLDCGVIAGGAWVVVASTSKAGLLALGVCVVLWLALDFRRQGRALGFAVAGAIALVVVGVATYRGGVTLPDNGRIELIRQRVDRSTPEFDDTLMGRGYTTIFDHLSMLPIGAGEGNFEALTSGEDGAFHPGELHSTLGAILMGYGIVGLMLLLTFLLSVVCSGGLAASLWIIPGLVYGIAHQGLRFSPFWIMLACVAASRRLSAPSQSQLRILPKAGVLRGQACSRRYRLPT